MKLKERRAKLGKTQIQAALEIGVNIQTYRMYEYGMIPGEDGARKCAAWLKRTGGI